MLVETFKMPLSRNAIRCIMVAWLWTVCYGFVLLSSAAAGAGTSANPCYEAGGGWEYHLLTTVLLNEPGSYSNDVGFQIAAQIKVDSIWKNPVKPTDRLLHFQVISPQLLIKSRKAPTPEGFVSHSSRLEELTNSAFLVHWSQGRVHSVYVPHKQPVSLVNLHKGIASLFQFQLLDGQSNETDTSGQCVTDYRSTGPNSFTKTKTACQSTEGTPYLLHHDELFSVNVNSKRQASYEMENDNSCIKHLKTAENHEMIVNIRTEAGYKVSTTQELTLKQTYSVTPMVEEKIDVIIEKLSDQFDIRFSHETLMIEIEPKMCQDAECPSFATLLSENLQNLASENFGKVKGATGYLKVLNAAREAKKEEILRILKGKKFKNILPAIYDILGSALTTDSHEAVMKTLSLTNLDDVDNMERYLWALSMNSHPKKEVIQDLLSRYIKTSTIEDKLQETLVLTIASMTNKYTKNSLNKDKRKIYNSVKEAIFNGIINCDKKPCQYYYIRALKNLKSPETVQKLLDIALNSKDNKASVTAMKALRSFPPSTWTNDVVSAARKIFFQIPKKYDSSSRTLSLDILIGADPSEELIRDLLYYLISNDKTYEVKKYTLQRINMLSEKNAEFRKKIKNVVRIEPQINNYAVMSLKGMSSALARQFLNDPVTNGTMISSQEMSSGLVKRGVFDIVLENDVGAYEMFSLGLFSGGLSNMLSSDESEEGGDNEPATAGMELTLMGTQIRPFVFFNGQGELMGHVWAGTASDSTSAFQINTLLHDHLQYLRLQAGLIAELNLKTALSFNLAGEIQISLWNRNSHSLVNENAGIVMLGLLRVDTSFVQSQVEFTLSTEPRLDLESDIEFGSGVAVCLRLMQPSTMFRHNIFKIERIPGSKHKLRKAKYRKVEIPGKTYNLNRKNNEMCNNLMQLR